MVEQIYKPRYKKNRPQEIKCDWCKEMKPKESIMDIDDDEEEKYCIDCVSTIEWKLFRNKITEKYINFCKKNGYCRTGYIYDIRDGECFGVKEWSV